MPKGRTGEMSTQPGRAVRWVGVLVAVALVLVSCSTPAPGSIKGMLADCGGPAPGHVIPTTGTVSVSGNGVDRSVHVTTTGRFEFSGLSPGSYTVSWGQPSSLSESVTVKAGSTRTVTLCFPIP